MAPALNFGLEPILREALEILYGELSGGSALPGELLANKRVSGHGAILKRGLSRQAIGRRGWIEAAADQRSGE